MTRTAATRPLLVVNPNAGGGKARRVFPELQPVIERALGECDVVFTERSGHAIELARDASAEGRELVVAIGGDGTLNEVANGVLIAQREGLSRSLSLGAAVGFIGQGTGGDFRRSLGIEHRLDRYLEALASGRTRTVDVGNIRYVDAAGKQVERFFLNVLSAGMGGLVDRYVAEGSRVLGPTVAYYAASLRALGAIERGRVEAKVTSAGAERKERLATYMLAICNGGFFGSGMNIAPMAKIDDGRFEVVCIGGGKLDILTLSRAVYSGAHLGRAGTVHFPCERIALALENAREAGATFLLDCDGEPIGGLPIEVDLVPRALTLRA